MEHRYLRHRPRLFPSVDVVPWCICLLTADHKGSPSGKNHKSDDNPQIIVGEAELGSRLGKEP